MINARGNRRKIRFCLNVRTKKKKEKSYLLDCNPENLVKIFISNLCMEFLLVRIGKEKKKIDHIQIQQNF